MSDGEYDVFISYSSVDVDIARRICTELEAQRYSVWWDRGKILAGDDLTDIFGAIQECKYFLIILSANSVRSRFVHEELSAARIRSIEQGHVTVIPILYESCPIPPALASKVFLDLTRSPHEGISELAETLRQHELRRKGETIPVKSAAHPTLGDSVGELTRKVRDAKQLYVATDLGGTKAYVSIMTHDGERLFDRKFTTQSHGDPSGLLSFLATSIEGTIHGVHQTTSISLDEISKRIRAFGIAFAGPTDASSGVVRDASNFQIKDFPLATYLGKRLGKPVFIENDANLGALGEAWKGAARSHRNIVGIVIGTGIGGGIVIDGQVYHGSHSAAGEIGHMIIDFSSNVVCGCGQRGCFEALASRKAIARELNRRKKLKNSSDLRWDENNLGSAQLADYVSAGDVDAVEVVGEAVGIWAKAVFALLNILNPDMIFFGGGFVQQLGERLGDSFLDPVRTEAQKCMNSIYEHEGKEVPIVIGQLDNPMLTGACLLAIRGNRSPSAKADFITAAVTGMSERDFKVLQSLYDYPEPTRINMDPGSDFHEDNLRGLRNRGLVATSNGSSFRRSKHIEITQLGRLVIEDGASSRGPIARSTWA
jgi:glucokinase